MFCKWCGKVAFLRGGPVAAHGCPVCEGSFFGGQEKVSRDDDPPGDDRSSSDDDDSSSDYCESSDDASYSSDDSTYSSEYSSSSSTSTSSSGDDGGGIVLIVLLVAGLIIATLISGKHSDPQSAPVVTSIPPAPIQSSPQSPPVYLFQNTLPGTYNMGQDQNEAQSNSTAPPDIRQPETSYEARNSRAESKSISISPTFPEQVRCILPTASEILVSRKECREQLGVIFIDE